MFNGWGCNWCLSHTNCRAAALRWSSVVHQQTWPFSVELQSDVAWSSAEGNGHCSMDVSCHLLHSLKIFLTAFVLEAATTQPCGRHSRPLEPRLCTCMETKSCLWQQKASARTGPHYHTACSQSLYLLPGKIAASLKGIIIQGTI